MLAVFYNDENDPGISSVVMRPVNFDVVSTDWRTRADSFVVTRVLGFERRCGFLCFEIDNFVCNSRRVASNAVRNEPIDPGVELVVERTYERRK